MVIVLPAPLPQNSITASFADLWTSKAIRKTEFVQYVDLATHRSV
jgi:hypothetical protein